MRRIRAGSRRALLALGLGGALAACDAPRPATPLLYTLFDVSALYVDNDDSSYAIATDAGLPGGVPLGDMLAMDRHTLSVQLSWAEGYPAAYVTTEVWSHFGIGNVWVQPMYVPITGWSNGQPQQVKDAMGAWHPIFSVGPLSRFYSPFWQMIYAVVPSTTQDGDLTSVQQILDGHYPLVPAAGWAAALTPDGVGLDPAAVPPSGGAVQGTGWIDGAPIAFVKFPAAPFTWDADLAVNEVPIYHFVYRKDDGTVIAAPIPSVLGTGPPGSRTPPPPPQADGSPSPRYSAYWRVYTVMIPPTARVFAPPFAPLYGPVHDAGLPAPDSYGDITAATTKVNDYIGRVTLNPECFASGANLLPHEGPQSCVYLDSQAAIEAALNQGAIQPTEITVTCPLVSINGMAVVP